jgi:hypothetical protein
MAARVTFVHDPYSFQGWRPSDTLRADFLRVTAAQSNIASHKQQTTAAAATCPRFSKENVHINTNAIGHFFDGNPMQKMSEAVNTDDEFTAACYQLKRASQFASISPKGNSGKPHLPPLQNCSTSLVPLPFTAISALRKSNNLKTNYSHSPLDSPSSSSSSTESSFHNHIDVESSNARLAVSKTIALSTENPMHLQKSTYIDSHAIDMEDTGLLLCSHFANWRRLRIKKGLSHMFCSYCGMKWKTNSLPYFGFRHVCH